MTFIQDHQKVFLSIDDATLQLSIVLGYPMNGYEAILPVAAFLQFKQEFKQLTGKEFGSRTEISDGNIVSFGAGRVRIIMDSSTPRENIYIRQVD